MPRTRFVPRRQPIMPEAPFADAETAWFWFMRCQKARWDGARFERGLAQEVRPCEPDDIYRCARRLVVEGKLQSRHFEVLARFGVLDRPPDSRRPDEVGAHRLWDEALDKLSTVLRRKGIVE